MHQPKMLDLTGGWEAVVNNVKRHNARCKEDWEKARRQFHRQLNKALCYALGAALAMALEGAGLLALWVAVVVAIVLLCFCCFTVGRIVGNLEV